MGGVGFTRPMLVVNDIGPPRQATPSSGGGCGGGQGGRAENECMICLSNFEPGQAIRVSRNDFELTETTGLPCIW